MNINDGLEHTVLFRNGNLFLDNVQIGGDGINQGKDIIFKFKTDIPKPKDPSILEVNVHDSVAAQALGPGQV